ncbi:NnrU family protein [Ramlibacter montanisoli]|uniref:NnrU family protein n=1 Tax=Ramlibacter montanisoli TaxID=2732512 RepID=A0A849KLC6_9BURK|nr:NnrU family protein [Ramlibacter montanisoli]NNU44743.1 NnrU family protein [Ramlibacter montanisoli]
MAALVLGLVLFLGLHSTRIFAEGWRTQTMESFGEKEYKLLYSVLSVAGFALLVWGYGLARHNPVILWNQPPVWTRHLASLLTLAAFVLLVAAYVPGNAIKAKARHPMILGVKVWALAHLISNNTLADLLLFGSFLVWAVLDYRAARRRERTLATVIDAGPLSRTILTVVVGVVAWAVFAMWAHRVLIGVSPLGR